MLLDACKILKEKGYKFVCNFVGGESKEITKDIFVNAIKERGLDGMVIYHGPKYGDEKKEFFANSDVFIQPTFEDCFPLTLLEAMQYKLPIVSTDEGAVPDMVKYEANGFICKRKDSGSTEDAIKSLLDSKDLRNQMGENGYKLFKEHFTLEVFNKNITWILKEIV